MKRKIIFRGKTIYNGKWVEGYIYQEIPETYTTYIMPSDLYNGYEYEVPDLCGDDMYRLQFEKYYEVIPESVGQYTGLKDKNGVEIYEGDIVAEEKRDEEDNIYICEFDNTDAKFVFCSPLDGESLEENNFASDLKVIGNIYQNPELLTTK